MQATSFVTTDGDSITANVDFIVAIVHPKNQNRPCQIIFANRYYEIDRSVAERLEVEWMGVDG